MSGQGKTRPDGVKGEGTMKMRGNQSVATDRLGAIVLLLFTGMQLSTVLVFGVQSMHRESVGAALLWAVISVSFCISLIALLGRLNGEPAPESQDRKGTDGHG